uniref:Uncharacterized protein n=1 Tax=Anopheles coluzzii TaxID=1518534 RepID=A0A8W7PHE5_ANOCL
MQKSTSTAIVSCARYANVSRQLCVMFTSSGMFNHWRIRLFITSVFRCMKEVRRAAMYSSYCRPVRICEIRSARNSRRAFSSSYFSGASRSESSSDVSELGPRFRTDSRSGFSQSPYPRMICEISLKKMDL